MRTTGFTGMQNVRQSSSFFADRKGVVTPRVILNADVSSDLILTKRQGQTKKLSLDKPHSLWAGSVMLCVQDGKLCHLEGTQTTEISDISGYPSYAEVNGLIYISSSSFTGIYDPFTKVVRDWGTPLPSMPSISVVSGGNMPPGRYCLCYTQLRDDGQMSGSGPIVEIEWAGDERGIELLNLSSDYLTWITDTNGTDFFLATVESNKIVTPHYDKPLPSLFCIPPPRMSFIIYAFGRLWGICNRKLYYSEPNALEWWKESNCFPFDEELVMVAPVQKGIFVASRKTTWTLKGTDPAKMLLEVAGGGVIPGSLVYDEFQQSGQEIPTWRHKSVLPAWMSQEGGFVIGNEQLYLANLTEGRLDINLGTKGVALSRKVDGQSQILVSMPVSENGDIGNIFNIGRIFIPGPLEVIGSGGIETNGAGDVIFE